MTVTTDYFPCTTTATYVPVVRVPQVGKRCSTIYLRNLNQIGERYLEIIPSKLPSVTKRISCYKKEAFTFLLIKLHLLNESLTYVQNIFSIK